ncbi:MAG: helix-turn-helix domain-containing protein [Myxococcota bacterium]|jgi:AcrR family transcriptional regulator
MSNVDSRSISRYERRRMETRGKILAAAGEIFGQQGVKATTVLDICEQADVAQQTFFNHFPTKGDLLLEMGRMGREFLIASVDSALGRSASTTARLEEIFTGLFAASIDTGPMHHELVTEISHGAQAAALDEATLRLRDAFVRLVRAGQLQGDVTRAHSAVELTRIFGGSLAALSNEWANDPDLPVKRRARALARVLGELVQPRAAGIRAEQ